MKSVLFLLLVIIINPFFGHTQIIENLDYISPYHNGLAAIQKNGQWAFINSKGDVIINYRTDVVLTAFEDDRYPVFYDDRCLIEQKKNGISYFGYIDTSGNVVIEPQFLNAANFINGKALALKLLKETVAQNRALDKSIVYYRYYDVVIEIDGTVKRYLNPEGISVVLDKEFLREPPKINSKRISDDLYAIMDKNKKWTLINLQSLDIKK
jgi:hypothetical protein